ncbi:MAG: agmatine deiminase [Flavobacteriales bacterium]|nr:agmatine deiminase [Flavobacteriales bacterium]|tara:strand:+ start:28253 stop:29263 length:1011 start_codon:yes stop_codon:yes gene_type:complete
MKIRLPAEWEQQDGVVMAWPICTTDWNENLIAVQETYVQIISQIADHQLVLLIAPTNEPTQFFSPKLQKNIRIIHVPYNDTWTRDYIGLSIEKESQIHLLNFEFNAWGEKFDFCRDNRVNELFEKNNLFKHTTIAIPFILEGGSIECNGDGVLITTSECLLHPNRNPSYSKLEIEALLKSTFGVHSIIWLNSGEIKGDDTNSHIDTLVRFCDKKTLVYAKDESTELIEMENELKKHFRNKAFNLIPIYQPQCKTFKKRNLPASYVNFLITNKKVLVPIYNDKNDQLAISTLQRLFTNRKVVGINCNELIKQNGSLHCITMHLHKGILKQFPHEQKN